MTHMPPAAGLVILAIVCATTADADDLAIDRNGAPIPLERPGGFARPRQVYVWQDGAVATVENPDATANPRYVTSEIYSEDRPDVRIRIANCGAGAAGLFEALAGAYFEHISATGQEIDFAVGWYLTDTTYSLQALAAGVVDIAVTYNKPLEEKAVADGSAVYRRFAFMDHFMLVGPVDNPAGIGEDDDVTTAFAKIIDAGCRTPLEGTGRTDCAYFLSRDDASATEIKERLVFDEVIAAEERFAPYRERRYLDETVAPWYYKCPPRPVACFPPVALQRAAKVNAYTLTDWGTWLANGGEKRAFPSLAILVNGLDETAPGLLNPATALLSPSATPEAKAFLDWMLAPDGGQATIATFGVARFGRPFYTPATEENEPK